VPTPILSLENNGIKKIFTGEYFTMMMKNESKLFSFGKNNV
jgi:hypothetical protein